MKRPTEAIMVVPEVLRPGEMEQRRGQTNMEMLDALVQKRVAEILTAREDFVFEPFFRSRQVAYELKRLQTVPERKKWGIFFERHGCLSCHKQDQPHASSGLCNVCHSHVFRKLKQIVSELMQDPRGGE
jgi:hypothetical protein